MKSPHKKLVDKKNQKKINHWSLQSFHSFVSAVWQSFASMTKNNKQTHTHKTQDQVAPAAAAGKQIKPKQGKITTQSNKSLPAQRCSTAVFKLAKAEADDDNIEQQLKKKRIHSSCLSSSQISINGSAANSRERKRDRFLHLF